MRACATTMASELREDELAFLVAQLRAARFSGRHLEIGTAAGGTLWRMIRALDDQGLQPPFVVVDPLQYFPRQREIVEKNLRDNGVDAERVDFRQMTSAQAVSRSLERGESFDFIFVDGCHKIHRVTEDLQWASLLRVGGVIAFHDYSPKYRGVYWAVSRFLRRHPHYQKVGQVHTLLLLRKTAPSLRPEIRLWDKLRARIQAPFLNLYQSIRKRVRSHGHSVG